MTKQTILVGIQDEKLHKNWWLENRYLNEEVCFDHKSISHFTCWISEMCHFLEWLQCFNEIWINQICNVYMVARDGIEYNYLRELRFLPLLWALWALSFPQFLIIHETPAFSGMSFESGICWYLSDQNPAGFPSQNLAPIVRHRFADFLRRIIGLDLDHNSALVTNSYSLNFLLAFLEFIAEILVEKAALSWCVDWPSFRWSVTKIHPSAFSVHRTEIEEKRPFLGRQWMADRSWFWLIGSGSIHWKGIQWLRSLFSRRKREFQCDGLEFVATT
jgi:hypothetical protein